MRRRLNLVGPQVSKARNKLGWTQDTLARELQLLGWDVSRSSVGKLESGLRWVSDCELVFLARALRCDLRDLFPRHLDYRKLGDEFR